MPTKTEAALLAAVRNLGLRQGQFDQVLQQLQALMKAQADSPKWIEEIPGRRAPYFAPVDLTIAADSTSAVTGTHTVSQDGPFVVTGFAAFFRKTSGSYQGVWGPVTAVDSKINPAGVTGMQHGYQFIFDHPSAFSGDIEIIDRGSDRNWQHRPVSSAIMHPQVGGAYVLPASNLFDTNSVIDVTFTPRPSVPYTGVLQVIMFGYKIVQGSTYQP